MSKLAGVENKAIYGSTQILHICTDVHLLAVSSPNNKRKCTRFCTNLRPSDFQIVPKVTSHKLLIVK